MVRFEIGCNQGDQRSCMELQHLLDVERFDGPIASFQSSIAVLAQQVKPRHC